MSIRIFLLCLLLAQSAHATAPRAALVIGNSNYGSEQSNLPNPANDAAAIAAALRLHYGFTVIEKYDLTNTQMEAALVEFKKLIEPGGVALFYYAGHALEDEGLNYLIPVRTRLNCDLMDSQLKDERVAPTAQGFLSEMGKAKFKIMVLDACRDSPYSACSRSGKRGLATMKAPEGTLISYATAPGQTASDGAGGHGLYTEHLLAAMQAGADKPISEVFDEVADKVFDKSRKEQKPYVFWVGAAGTGKFCLSLDGCRDKDKEIAELRQQLAQAGQSGGISQQVLQQMLERIERLETQKTPPDQPPIRDNTAPSGVIPSPRHKQAFRDCADCPEMVFLSGGSFQMGSNDGRSGEKPVHSVTVEAFALGKYEVTFEEYDKFCEATGRDKPEDEGWGRGKRPVINVSWNDAVAYTEWLSQKTGKEYRLPTEAEWEYAARAGTSTAYSFGDDAGLLGEYAWYGDNSGNQTHPVGGKKPNGFGLYDMHGNVWEWTCSEYASYKDGKENACLSKNHANNTRLLRGGSWLLSTDSCRAAYRLSLGYRLNSCGFRVLCVVAPRT